MNNYNWTVGTKYKTRGGSWAKVVAIVPECDMPILALHNGDGGVHSHFTDGSLYGDETDKRDLFPEEWVEPKPKVRRYRYRYQCNDQITDDMHWWLNEADFHNHYRADVKILKQIDEDEFDQ